MNMTSPGSLHFKPEPDGLVVQMGSDPQIPVGAWTSHTEESLGVGALIRMRDEGGAIEQDEGTSLMVHWKSVAGLTPDELRYIGLPDAAPFALEVVANGAIPDRDFEIHYGFIAKGRRVVGVERLGAWLGVSPDNFVLLDPIYTITESIDRFKTERDLESRMLRWGRIAEMLPDSAMVDDHLQSLNIVVASCFELHPFVNQDGEPDFDPVIGRRETRVSGTEEEKQIFSPSLPDARQQDFARYFRRLRRVKHRYGVGAGFYVVLTPTVERALRAVRKAQSGTAAERRDFLRNVSGYLSGALGETDINPTDIDSIFSDEGLSERVRGIGVWTERVLPWISLAPQPWLPPEELGLRVGSEVIMIEADDLPRLLGEVQEAIEKNEPSVCIDDVIIPADSSTVSAIEELIRNSQPVQPPDVPTERRGEPEEDDVVLLIYDNLKDVNFRRKRRSCVPNISSVTPALRTQLLPHQQVGLEWLQRHWEAGSWGALLADDMGLGKTLEALAFLSSLTMHATDKKLQKRPMLIVSPTGLLQNWLDEHKKHLSEPGLGRAIEAHGTGLRKIRTNPKESGNELGSDIALPKLKVGVLEEAAWVLTTYETLRNYQHSFGRVRWRVAVFDESQKIKNPGARITEAALAMNIDFALMMTGTPVENRTADIWSMLDRVEPGVFGTLKDFSEKYEKTVANDQSPLRDLHHKLINDQRHGEGVAIYPALMLRRLKEDHLSGLPDKRVHRRIVDMPPLQAERYERAVLRGRHNRNMLDTLHHLRSISLHPTAPTGMDADRYIRESARLSETFGILDSVAARDEKALVFVESREMQDFLIGVLRRRFRLTDDVLVINGAVAGKLRKARVDKFQERAGFDVMILSPRAGGVGLTLTAANHVIHLSRWWNPAVEDQCTDRVFRIGQTNTVHVYLPLARHPHFGEHSFDLKLNGLMERKREMSRRVLAPTVATDEDVGGLFRSTTMETRDVARSSDGMGNGVNIDLLEPTKFEEWVLRKLGLAGYETHRTPHSGDRGADGLAIWKHGPEPHTIVVQCKHTQSNTWRCARTAVEEVLRSIQNYSVVGTPKPMVVTNARGFTEDAQDLARQKGVRLVHRHGLKLLSKCRSHQNE